MLDVALQRSDAPPWLGRPCPHTLRAAGRTLPPRLRWAHCLPLPCSNCVFLRKRPWLFAGKARLREFPESLALLQLVACNRPSLCFWECASQHVAVHASDHIQIHNRTQQVFYCAPAAQEKPGLSNTWLLAGNACTLAATGRGPKTHSMASQIVGQVLRI